MSPGLFGPAYLLRPSSIRAFRSLHSAPVSQPSSALPVLQRGCQRLLMLWGEMKCRKGLWVGEGRLLG